MFSRRIKMILEYVGTAYCGWQVQDNGLSIQEVVTSAVKAMVGHDVSLVGSSRTDSGVHALGLPVHFDTTTEIPTFGFLRGLNSILPSDIRVVSVEDAPSDFHAQRDAKKKWYRYLILNAPHASAILSNRSWHRFRDLNIDLMNEVSQQLVGQHDFTAYCAIDDQSKSKERTVLDIQWHELKADARLEVASAAPLAGHLIACDVVGEGFLKQMVRNIVGTVLEVGEGRRQAGDIKKALDAKDRRAGGVCAPAEGLYLMKVYY
ncbi:MAG: tRNA pseudouridine(38-40) synthase TruA [Deltaproteobacteria bacterium CG11_big_fil_rev_8_21_14_0_20_47_16]|nr:MAG: tRNA pseudouridine(38-40) synthase TruA [Deltaproteobacteria bacterium CG11_big_fil_rev_8_21_14_0_20_47_16]